MKRENQTKYMLDSPNQDSEETYSYKPKKVDLKIQIVPESEKKPSK